MMGVLIMKPNFRVHEPIIPCNPPEYRCFRAAGKTGVLDGDVEKDFWKTGEWIEDFHDIQGDSLPRPWKKTRVKPFGTKMRCMWRRSSWTTPSGPRWKTATR